MFQPGFGTDDHRLRNHLTGAGADTIQFAASEFADFGAMLSHTADVNGVATITNPTNGDQLTLLGVTTAQVAAHAGDFAFK